MSAQSRLRHRALAARPQPAARRGLLSHAVAALAISALGLGIAGSIAPTTSAQPRPLAPVGSAAPVRAVPSASPTEAVDPAVTAPFEGSDQQPEPLRKVLVAERAAQRAEELAKEAEAVSRAARQEGSRARQQQLTAAEKATQERAAQLAKEALERVAAARAAAVTARLAAEAAANQQANQQANADSTTANRPPAPGPSPAPAAPPLPGPLPPPPPPTSGGGFAPVPNAVVGASFGEYGLWSRYHTGLDFRAAYGVPIRSARSGVVLYAGNSGDWAGIHVAVRHGDGMTSMSSHMSRMAVSAGQTVQAGQIIGYVGQTGRAFGAHLHYELYPAGVRYGDVYRAVNPVPWLRAAGITTR